MSKQTEYEQKKSYRQMNMCPYHGTRLETTYYEDIDLLITKCKTEDCIDGHGMTEDFKFRKDKRKRNWLKKNAPKIVDDTIAAIVQEDEAAPTRH